MANPFDQFDSPASPPDKAQAKTVNPFDQFDAPKQEPNPFDAFDPGHVESIQDPVEHASQFEQGHPEWEAAFQADQARRNRSLGQKAMGAADQVFSLTPWAQGIKGVGKFATGLGLTAFDTARQAVDSGIAGAASVVGADKVATDFGNKAKQLKAENILAAQGIEENLARAGKAVMSWAPKGGGDPYGSMDSFDAQSVMDAMTPEQKKEHEVQMARQDFADKVEAAKRGQKLAGGTPLDTGVVAAITPNSGQPLSETYGPEGLAASGAEPVRPLATEMKTAAADPMNILLAAAPGLPGARTIAGGGVELAGKAMQLPGRGISYLASKAGKLGRAIDNPAVLVGEGGLALALHAPTAKAVGVVLGAKLGQRLGEAMAAQGREFRTGIPSALTEASAAAKDAGKSAIGANLGRFAGDSVVRGAATAYGFAPVNAVLSEGDPEEFARSEVGAGIFGSGLGALHARPSMRAMDAALQGKLMDQHGGQQFTDNSAYPVHQSIVANYTPENRSAINRLRSYFFGGTRTDILVVDGNTFAQKAAEADNSSGGKGQAAGTNARGVFLPSPDGSTIYLNNDALSASPVGAQGKAINTAGHEGGHAVVKWLMDAGRAADAQGMMDAISSRLSDADKVAMAKSYWDALEKSTIGVTPANRDAVRAKIENDHPLPKIIEENLAEITRSILDGKDVSQFTLGKPIESKVMDAAARMMEALKFSAPIDPNSRLGFKTRMVKEAARRMQDILYDVGGKSRTNRDQTTPQTIRDLQRQLDAIPKYDDKTPFSKAQEYAAQMESLQRRLDAAIAVRDGEASAQPTAAQAAPGNAKALADVRLQAHTGLKGMGYASPQINKWISQAYQQHGSPIEDTGSLIRAVLKLSRGETIKPGEFIPQPAAPVAPPTPVAAPTGEKVNFKDETGAQRIITGTSPNPPQVGDIVATRDGEIRRVTRALGDTVDTARTIDPLNARGTKTHGIADVVTLTHDYAPAQEGASPSTPAEPAFTVKPSVGGRFQIVDASGNPVSKTTFATEADARQSIARTGQRSTFGLPPSANGNDILDAIIEEGGINLSGMLKEERDHDFPHKGIWKNSLTTDNPNLTPDEVARLVQDRGHGDGTPGTMFAEITKAIAARSNLRDQAATEAKRQKAEAKNTSKDIGELLGGMGGGISDSLYQMLFDKLKSGDLTEAGRPSTILKSAKPLFDNGTITTPEELKSWVQSGRPNRENLEPDRLKNEQTTPAPNKPLPAGGSVATKEPVVATETPARTQRPTRTLPSREAVDAIVADAEQKAVAKEKNTTTKAAQERIYNAKVDAIMDAIGNDPEGMHRVKDSAGGTKIVGNFDISNPYHAALADLAGGISEKADGNLQRVQGGQGNAMHIRYRSAKSQTEETPWQRVGMTIRKGEYSEDPAAERAEGTIQHKAIIPVQTVFKGGRPMETVFTLDNLLHNAESYNNFIKSKGLTDMPVADEGKMKRYAQIYADNHAHGWKGDGSGPMKGFPDSGLPTPDLNYKAETIPKDDFDLMNLLMHSEDAGKYAARIAEVAAKQEKVKAATTDLARATAQGVLDRAVQRMKTSEEAFSLGAENNPWVDHSTGETNELRAKLKAAGLDTNDAFKSPFETLDPQHILDISDARLPMQSGDVPTVRQTSFNKGAENLEPMGSLNLKAVSAGFMPEEQASDQRKTPQELARYRIAARFMPEEDSEPFYSQLTRTIQSLPQESMTVAQARAAISKGAKPAEIAQQGIFDDPLSPLFGKQPNEKVSKSDLAGYSMDRQAKVQDVTLGGINEKDNLRKLIKKGIEQTDEDDLDEDGYPGWKDYANTMISNAEKAIELIDRNDIAGAKDLVRDNSSMELEYGDDPAWGEARRFVNGEPRHFTDEETSQPHFSKFQLPGSDEGSYREMFVTWPNTNKPAKPFASGPIPDAPKEWTFKTMSNGRFKAVAPDGMEYGAPKETKDGAIISAKNGWKSFHETQRNILKEEPNTNWNDGHDQYSSIQNPIVRIRRNLRTDPDGKRVYFIEELQGPNPKNQSKMPPEIRKRIYEIGMKSALREAVNEGADKIAWTTGEQQADRYDLSKQIGKVSVSQATNGEFHVKADKPDGGNVLAQYYTPEELPEVIGKELAQKIVRDSAENPTTNDGSHKFQKTYSGLDLKTGGEGLKRLYDQTLPRIANELAKKFGVKVESSKIKTNGHELEEVGVLSDGTKIYRETNNSGVVADNADGIRLFDDLESYLSSIPESDREEVYDIYYNNTSDSNSGQRNKIFNGVKETVHSLEIPAALREQQRRGNALFMPDSGTPEEGGTPGERLAREAEQAGVVLNIDTLKGLIHDDKEAMNRVRSRIQQNTGKPARFLPTTQPAPAGIAKNETLRSSGPWTRTQDDRKKKLDVREAAKERIRQRELATH